MGDNRWLRNSFVYLIILVAAVALLVQYGINGGRGSGNPKSFDEIVDDALTGQVQ
jgi:cell division protease FtsH